MRDNLDTQLLVITAAVWLAVALVYHFSGLIDMPDAERIWSLSAATFLGITAWVAAAQRRGQKLTDGATEPEAKATTAPSPPEADA